MIKNDHTCIPLYGMVDMFHFLKYMPWSCEIPTSLVFRNVCNYENYCRFNKIPWNQVNVNGFDNFDNFFNQILQSKINLADLRIFSPYSLLHVFPDIWNKLPCKGLMCFSFFFFASVQFVSRSRPLNSHKLFKFQTELNSTMR